MSTASQFLEYLETLSPESLDTEIEQQERRLAGLKEARKLIGKMRGDDQAKPRSKGAPKPESRGDHEWVNIFTAVLRRRKPDARGN